MYHYLDIILYDLGSRSILMYRKHTDNCEYCSYIDDYFFCLHPQALCMKHSIGRILRNTHALYQPYICLVMFVKDVGLSVLKFRDYRWVFYNFNTNISMERRKSRIASLCSVLSLGNCSKPGI